MEETLFNLTDSQLRDYNYAVACVAENNRTLIRLLRKVQNKEDVSQALFAEKSKELQDSIDYLVQVQKEVGFEANVSYFSTEPTRFEEDGESFMLLNGDIQGNKDAAFRLGIKWRECCERGDKGYGNYRYEVARILIALSL